MKVSILEGDALEKLRELPGESVRCCVTSPPYWGLRDYGTARWEGVSEECDHRAGSDYGEKSDTNRGSIRGGPFRDECGKCGARRIDSQLGLERTPEEYVEKLVAVFREVRRVLAKDGTLWLNLGDSYASGSTGRNDTSRQTPGGRGGSFRGGPRKNLDINSGLKPKDLVGIPWRVAFALQADGWYLRSEIIWAKPNPMPESVTDRPTKAHEQFFLLAKSSRYYYDAEAIAEEQTSSGLGGFSNKETLKSVRLDASHAPSLVNAINDGKRNKRTVWTIATQPFPEAHFATFPPALVEPCILAGSAVGDTVLDPFAGAGTTGLVASRLHRDFIGIELNPKYAEMARQRIRQDAPLFNEVATMST